MSHRRNRKKDVVFRCDESGCKSEIATGCKDFSTGWGVAKGTGWKSIMTKISPSHGRWRHVCPSCYSKRIPDYDHGQ